MGMNDIAAAVAMAENIGPSTKAKKGYPQKGCAPHEYRLHHGIWMCKCGQILRHNKKL